MHQFSECNCIVLTICRLSTHMVWYVSCTSYVEMLLLSWWYETVSNASHQQLSSKSFIYLIISTLLLILSYWLHLICSFLLITLASSCRDTSNLEVTEDLGQKLLWKLCTASNYLIFTKSVGSIFYMLYYFIVGDNWSSLELT